jgi:hypothetical protein
MAGVARSKIIAPVAAAAVALGVVAAAALGAASPPQLRVGDRVDVTGTPVRCVAGKQARKRLVSCFLVGKTGRPVAGSVGIALSATGTIKVVRFKRNGNATLVFKRTLQSVSARTPKTYQLATGTIFQLRDSKLFCAIHPETNDKVLGTACYLWESDKRRPNSYGSFMNAKLAGVAQVDGTGKQSKIIKTYGQPAAS